MGQASTSDEADLHDESSRDGTRHSNRSIALVPTAILLLGLFVQGAVMLSGARRVWFWRDDWAFLRPRDRLGLWRTIVLNYNGHWSAVPWVWFRTMRHFFGIRHYLPYAVMPVLLQLLAFFLLYLLLRRTDIGRWAAMVSVLVTSFLAVGVGAENTLWLATIGFLGSCAFGLLGVLLADLGGRWRWVAPIALLLAVMCSNVGLIMIALAASWGLIRLGLRTAVAIVVGPTVIYVAWFLRYARIRPPAGSGRSWNSSPPVDWGHGTVRMATGIADVWSAAMRIPGVGPVVLVVLVIAVLLVRRDRALVALGAGGLLALVFGFALFGFGKASPHTLPTQPRYEYVGVLVCGAAVGCLAQVVATHGRRLPWACIPLGGIIVVLAGVVGLTQTVSAANALQPQTTELRNRVIATSWLSAQGQTFLTDAVWPDPKINHGVTVSMLNDPGMRSFVPNQRPPDRALLMTQAQVQVGVGASAFKVPQTVCSRAGHGPVTIRTGAQGGQFRVRFSAASGIKSLRTRLISGARRSAYTKWRVDARGTVYVGTSAPSVTLQVLLPRSGSVRCDR
ncbi:MAG: hypothetical protein FWE71_11640 [Nocardioidaceae bacterium]|nr:hypothetical protein [Nocardioidaceae bacterium]MCL2613756.1 hypothetical protein [Nocardioidaceae bacterium]